VEDRVPYGISFDPDRGTIEAFPAPVPLQLDRLRHLRLTNRAILRAERELSTLWGKRCSLFEILSESLGVNDLSVILWQGLLHEDPRLTLEYVQEHLMDMRRLSAIMIAVLDAWNAATAPAAPPDVPQNGEAPVGPFATTSPGSPSGALPGSILASGAGNSGV
jgi:hypothetical protein